MKNKFLIVTGTFVVSLMTAFVLTNGNAFAAAKTWDGGGSDDKFSTGANWDGDTAPANGDSISFPLDVIYSGCTGNMDASEPNNDLSPSSVTFAGINFTGEKPVGCNEIFRVVGNDLKTTGDISGVDSPIVIENNIVAEADLRIEKVSLNGTLNTGNHIVTIGDRFNIIYNEGTGSVVGTNKLIFDYEPVFGHGGIECNGIIKGSPFSGDGSGFTGAIEVKNSGLLTIGSNSNSLGRSASSITIKEEAILNIDLLYEQDGSFNTSLIFASGTPNLFVSQTYKSDTCDEPTQVKSLTLNGNVEFSVDTKVFLSNANLKLMGSVTGKEKIKLQSGQTGQISFADGTVTRSELKVTTITDSSNCGDLFSALKNNKVILNVDCGAYVGFNNPSYPLQLEGILGGTGKMQHVKVLNTGVIAPGLSPGTLTVGNIEWVEGGTYEFEIGKDAADQIKAIGSVKLGNGTLKVLLYDGAKPEAGKKYVIIDNDGTDAIVGTFKDLPENATFTAQDGGVYRINYGGGDGNDVTLTVVSAPKTPNTGFNMLKNNPIITMVITTVSALFIAVIARRKASSRI